MTAKQRTKLQDLAPNPRNPRKIEKAKLEFLAKALHEFGDLGGVVFNRTTKRLVGGHQRQKALPQNTELYIEEVYDPPTAVGTCAEGYFFVGDEKFRYREVQWDEGMEMAANIAANKGAGMWDYPLLAEMLLDLDHLNFDMDLTMFDAAELGAVMDGPQAPGEGAGAANTYEDGKAGNLAKVFVVPPFSVLDTRQGYWQERKDWWLAKTGNLSETKEGTLASGDQNLVATINEGSSNFDPVLAELAYKWFCPPGGHILDPFGGEQTKGVVAGELGYFYSAVEFRQAQVDVNKRATEKYRTVSYVCGDSNRISELVAERDLDFVFTSPPYYDLEVYSKTDMSALGTYAEFMAQYENIFKQCVVMLANNRFLAVKVGEIRCKKTGIYRNFVGDNIALFRRLGLHYYNELTLISPAGTAQLRAARSMNTRKMVKLHQNVLVFFKGDPKAITDNFPKLEAEDEEAEA